MFPSFYKKHMILSHLLMVVCVSIFLLIFAFFFLDVWTNHGRTTLVPEVKKKSFEEATEILNKSHLKYEISDSVYNSSLPPGTVTEMWPHAGTRVKPGRQIFLTVNSFEPQKITIPDKLVGVSARQAISTLEGNNIKNIRIVYVPSSFSDLVISASVNGKKIDIGSKVPVTANVVLEVGTETQQIREEREAMDKIVTTIDEDSDEEANVANPDAFD